jgi:methyl-accepting chemotaxis protein
VARGEAMVADVGGQIGGIAAHVVAVSQQIGDIAGLLDLQRSATGEIARNIHGVAENAARSRDGAVGMIRAVGDTEALIVDQFAALAPRQIPDAVLHRAKSDHLLWKKKLAQLLGGVDSLAASELVDHHSCRLGKWYDSAIDPQLRALPQFQRLLAPHEAVHACGRRAAELHHAGHHDQARAEYDRMDAASHELLQLLDRLIAVAKSEAADA